jgi:hypothetical protein
MREHLHPSERPAEALILGAEASTESDYPSINVGFQLTDTGRIVVMRIPVDDGLDQIIRDLAALRGLTLG